MGDSLEVRINIVEYIQKAFGLDIQEIKGQLTKLTKLIEEHTGIVSENIHGSPFIPLQSNSYPLVQHSHPNHEPRIPVVINVLSRVHHPNWQPQVLIPAIIPAFGKTSQPVDPANSSRNNLEKSRKNRDKKRLDPIPVTYIELLFKLLTKQLIALSCVLSLKPPFFKSYNLNVRCDYHIGNLGHSMEDCISLKHWVQTLIEVGMISFESPNSLSNLPLNFFEVKTEEVKRNILTIENISRMVRLKEKEFATMGRRILSEKIGCITEKIEEEKKALELQKENEKLQRLVQDMVYMLNEQKKSIVVLRRGI